MSTLRFLCYGYMDGDCRIFWINHYILFGSMCCSGGGLDKSSFTTLAFKYVLCGSFHFKFNESFFFVPSVHFFALYSGPSLSKAF